MAEQTLKVQLIDSEAALKEEALFSLDTREEELFHEVENREYVADFARKHVFSDTTYY